MDASRASCQDRMKKFKNYSINIISESLEDPLESDKDFLPNQSYNSTFTAGCLQGLSITNKKQSSYEAKLNALSMIQDLQRSLNTLDGQVTNQHLELSNKNHDYELISRVSLKIGRANEKKRKSYSYSCDKACLCF